MKKLPSLYLLLSLSFISIQLTAQTSFSDNFNDSNFTANPIWSGETSKFEVNAAKELQLNNTGAASNNETYLTTTSTIVNSAFWEFYVRLDFSPSSSNLAKVYLVSDNQDLTAVLNGYYVQIGGQSGTVDDVRLYRQDGLTDTLLIDGANGTVGTNPAVKIRVTKSATNEWNLFLDQSGVGSAYQLQGVSTEDKFVTSNYFGVLCKYTSTRSDKFFFDDFVVNGTPFQDTVKPIISQVNVTSDSTLSVNFNEKLDSSSALLLSNYSVNKGIGNPLSVQFTSNDSLAVRLVFTAKFVNGSSYELITKNVEDKSGNLMLNDTSSFFYFVPVPAAYRDIVINELYPDPTPSNGLPEAEFIELFNASKKVFDLDGWVINDGSNRVLSTQILRPGEYVIICHQASTTAFSSYGTVQGLASFPALSNSGKNISLLDNFGQTVDFVNYNISWYKDPAKDDGGFTLEQINPFTDCFGANNFTAAVNAIGGTPGAINSTFDSIPDQIGPQLLRVKVVTRDTLLFEFNEFIDTNSVGFATFQFNQGLLRDLVYNIKPDFRSIKVLLLTPIDSGIVYTVSVDGITDCYGNNIQNGTETFEFLIPALANYRDLVINEIYADTLPSFGLPSAEFIEVFNASNKTFDLENWTLSDGSSASLSSQIIKPGEYFILCSNANALKLQAFGNTLGIASFPSLGNSGDNVTLKDNKGEIIDFVNYTDDWYQDENKKNGGYSLEQINPFSDCNGRANFIASPNAIGGTPGALNGAFDSLQEVMAPRLLELLLLNDSTISLLFNESMDSASIRNGTYTFSPSILIDTVIPTAPNYELAVIRLKNKLAEGVIYSLNVSNVNDCSGNPITSNTNRVALPSIADKNDLVINEILFNSRSGSVDFVELYNRSEKVITLKNCQIANFVGDTIGSLKMITEETILVFPKDYIVLTENKTDIIQQYPLSVEKNIFEINDLPTYNDDEGRVYLFDSNQELIDEVEYKDDYHFALLINDDGVSLERINSDRSGLDETNWHSASEKVGFATPGYKNSQDFTNPKSSGIVSTEPNIISPNNDGFQDLLSINYKFDAPGFVANVSILDRNGRLIKKLVNNELLGSEGSFFWDGITDENSKARIGVYVVLFEAFNLDGDKEVFKEVITVASQLK